MVGCCRQNDQRQTENLQLVRPERQQVLSAVHWLEVHPSAAHPLVEWATVGHPYQLEGQRCPLAVCW